MLRQLPPSLSIHGRVHQPPERQKRGLYAAGREMPEMGGVPEMTEWTIIGPDGKPKMSTTHAECLPPPEILRQMKKAGYKIKTTERKP